MLGDLLDGKQKVKSFSKEVGEEDTAYVLGVALDNFESDLKVPTTLNLLNDLYFRLGNILKNSAELLSAKFLAIAMYSRREKILVSF